MRKILLLAMSLLAGSAGAQGLKPVFDGRLTLKPTALSAAEQQLLKEQILPAARRAWHERGRDKACEPDFKSEGLDVATGSFTRPKADQKAILYRYCEFGHNWELHGIAILEGGKVVVHVVYAGGADNAIGALPDINGNGLSEIILAGGGTNQGITTGAISIIELAGSQVRRLGSIVTYTNDCGFNPQGKSIANRLSVKTGPKPVFYRQEFIDTGGCEGETRWQKKGTLAPITLNKDEVAYEVLK